MSDPIDETPKPEEATPAEASPDASERPKRKKKKKDAAEPVDDPRVAVIEAAFGAGNFQRVRELAAELSQSDDAAIRVIGQDYASRIAVDGVQIAFLGICAVALLTIAWIYVPH